MKKVADKELMDALCVMHDNIEALNFMLKNVHPEAPHKIERVDTSDNKNEEAKFV